MEQQIAMIAPQRKWNDLTPEMDAYVKSQFKALDIRNRNTVTFKLHEKFGNPGLFMCTNQHCLIDSDYNEVWIGAIKTFSSSTGQPQFLPINLQSTPYTDCPTLVLNLSDGKKKQESLAILRYLLLIEPIDSNPFYSQQDGCYAIAVREEHKNDDALLAEEEKLNAAAWVNALLKVSPDKIKMFVKGGAGRTNKSCAVELYESINAGELTVKKLDALGKKKLPLQARNEITRISQNRTAGRPSSHGMEETAPKQAGVFNDILSPEDAETRGQDNQQDVFDKLRAEDAAEAEFTEDEGNTSHGPKSNKKKPLGKK
jgi:hypothetical protein